LTRRSPRRAVTRALLVALVIVLTGACRVKTDIGIDVQSDGSGTVTVAIGFDDDAMTHIGNLGATLRTDDLTKAGWTVQAPQKDTDGFTYVRLSKPFANPSQADAVFAEIAGTGGPFRQFHLARTRSFARTEMTFTGTVDFSAGLTSFTDSGLAQQLDGKPLGQDIATIEQRLGEPIDRVFTFRVLVRLPGDVTSNSTTKVANGAVWEPKLSDSAPSALVAKGSSWRVGTIAFTAVGAIALMTLLVVLLVRLRRRHRRT
jgi:hypothetical protein